MCDAAEPKFNLTSIRYNKKTDMIEVEGWFKPLYKLRDITIEFKVDQGGPEDEQGNNKSFN